MSSPTLDDFNRQLYILASIRHIKDNVPPRPSKSDKTEEKHLELLDYIALLLVTKSSGDVAAVGMEIGPSAIVFYYAKNGPCEPSVRVYVDKIASILRVNEPNDVPTLIMMIAMVQCADKFKARVKKCQKALEDCGEIRCASPGSFYASRLTQWSVQDDSKILHSFCDELRLFDTSIAVLRSQPETSMRISKHACLLGTMALRMLTRIS